MLELQVVTFDESEDVVERIHNVTHVTYCPNGTLMLTRRRGLVRIKREHYQFFSVVPETPFNQSGGAGYSYDPALEDGPNLRETA